MKRYIYWSLIIFTLLLLMPLTLIFFIFQSKTIVTDSVISKPNDARRARAIFREFRALTEASSNKRSLTVSENDINSMIAVARRAVPGLRGRSYVRGGKLKVSISLKNPYFPGGWINADGVIQSSPKGIKISSANLGPYGLPASWLIPAGAFILDMGLGDSLGQVAVNSIGKVEISERQATFHVILNRDDRKRLASKFKSKVRELAGVGSEKDVRSYYYAMDKAAKSGSLPKGGSMLPFIRYTLRQVLEKSQTSDFQKQKRAALLALAIYCGHPKFEQIVGTIGNGKAKWKSACFYSKLGGRVDLARHFIISAGLKAASDAGFAFAIGEFKELLDSNKGGSGFSFDDLAADRAGIRFAEVILKADAGQINKLIQGLVSEDAIFPSIEGLPSGLSKEEFVKRFTNVESDKYKTMLKEIEKRIDQLYFYQER